MTDALQNARREGVEQGIEQGRREGICTVVSRMLDQGVDWQVIKQLTSVDEARYRNWLSRQPTEQMEHPNDS